MLTVVGLGPGNEDYLTLRAIDTLRRASIVLTPRRFLHIVKKYARDASILALDPRNVREQVLQIAREAERDNVVVVSSGDPLFSGIGKIVLDLGIKCEIIPGYS